MKQSLAGGPRAPIDPARRRLLAGLVAALGGGMIAGAAPLETALAYAPRSDSTASDGAILSRQQLLDLRALCSQTIPATDTPGAAEVDVHGFVDHQIAVCHGPQDQGRVLKALQALAREAEVRHSAPFSDVSAAGQLALLLALEQGRDGFSAPEREDFKFLKNLVVFGYYTSEVGATRELRFDPVPGGFQGDYPYPEDGRAWWR